ncbi:MAG: right-handed parallel beta-helix repeat-containing protein, partial [Bacteroidales bacterium]|nr:right-handed parallel beta-helix repeat-containing protein [Bacteroidales bacterium]
MKKHLLFLMALTFAGVSVWAQATITVGPSGADYTTIQEAVDVADPGDIINVAAGIYAENVVVNKAVIIEGPNKNVDPRIAAALRTSGSSAEAIVDGGGSSSPVFEITVAGVVLNGIEIRNGTGDLVSSPSGAPVKTGVIVKYCIVNNAGDEGIQLRNVDGGGVEYCYIHNTIGDGINLSSECTNSYIKNNQVTTSASNDAAIYLYSNGPNMLINNNLVSGVTSANGIMIGIKNGNDANKNSSYANNAIVSNNIVTGHTASGVGVYVNTSRVNIIDNTITNWNSGTNAALYLRFNIKDIIVTGNDISGNNNGIKVSSGVTTSSALTFLINENNLSGNTTWGLTNSSSGAVNATCNWWGTADGSAIAAFISGDAEYLPYSTSDNPVNCDGVGPVVVYEGNTANIRSTHFTIQAGIDAAVAGDVIKVAAGIYNEFVVIDKALTLQGAFSGFPGNDYGRDGSNESVIIPPGNAIRIAPAGTSTYLITINAENVVIDGFTLMDGKDENGKYGANGGVFSGVGSINIQNNRIVGLPKYGIAVHRSAGNVVTSGMIV